MKIKQTLLSGLLLVSAGLLAGEPVLVQEPTNTEFLKNSLELFSRKQTSRNFLKINKSSALSSARDWDEAEMTSGGFFLSLGIYIPSGNYLRHPIYNLDTYYGLGYEFEIGNYFRFGKVMDGKLGIGMRATWLDFGYTSQSAEDYYSAALQFSLIRLGPQVAYALNETMAVDVFYQIGYNYTQEVGVDGEYAFAAAYGGITHEIGAGFRFKVFSVGLGYRFGRLNNFFYTYDDGDDYSEFFDGYRFSSSNFRVTLGFKF